MIKNTRRIRLLSLMLAALLFTVFLTGCTKPAPQDPDTPTPVPNGNKTAQGIHLAAGTGYSTLGEVEKLYINAMNSFSAALIKNLGSDWTGVVSPVSLSLILELLANGSDDTAHNEILNALMLDLGMLATNENAARLINALEKSVEDITHKTAQDIAEGKTSDKENGAEAKLQLLSAIIVGANDSFSEQFETNAADYYKASIGSLDFTDNEAALNEINSWVNKGTNGLIPELFSEISPDTAMALLNVLYFKAEWEKPFIAYRETSNNNSSFFHGLRGDYAVSMLSSTAEYSYGEYDDSQIVLVPYKGGEFYMALILPKYGITPQEALATSFDRYNSCENAVVSIRMPAVSISTNMDMMQLLPSLGLGSLADGSTVFPEIVENADIRLTQFVHGAVLNVTEYGTEAAAASGITGTKNAAPSIDSKYTVVCDRPYAMAIIHAQTGAVLFASVVNDIPQK